MRRPVTDWSPAEDLRPANGAAKPHETAGVKVWYQLAYFEWDGLPSYTQLTIREEPDKTVIDHGRIWPVVKDEDDGA